MDPPRRAPCCRLRAGDIDPDDGGVGVPQPSGSCAAVAPPEQHLESGAALQGTEPRPSRSPCHAGLSTTRSFSCFLCCDEAVDDAGAGHRSGLPSRM